jgi:hypothetical protein
MSTDDTTPLARSADDTTPIARPTDATSPVAGPTDATARLDDPALGTPVAGSPHGTAEPTSAPEPAPARHGGLRVGTVVWGLVLALVGIGVTAIGAGASLDVQAAIIVLLVVAGTALLAGAVVTARRASRP